ncbi:MAG: protein of unknown function DUF2968 [Idiomarinaceae bacterium HL-53]|nr:MAG: protein of unknown function DUF2968 [Idiomarinaceae bacterium HL-53]CUS48167.1 hypothetical protein Ga0003345_1106 [Idiomarinaceae bacterium HL-53]
MRTDSASITVNAFTDYRRQQAERTATVAERQAERLQQEADKKRNEAQALEAQAEQLSRDADRQENRAQIAERSVQESNTLNTLDRQIKTVTGSLERQTGTIVNTEV